MPHLLIDALTAPLIHSFPQAALHLLLAATALCSVHAETSLDNPYAAGAQQPTGFDGCVMQPGDLDMVGIDCSQDAGGPGNGNDGWEGCAKSVGDGPMPVQKVFAESTLRCNCVRESYCLFYLFLNAVLCAA